MKFSENVQIQVRDMLSVAVHGKGAVRIATSLRNRD